jgi:hypothetical protein
LPFGSLDLGLDVGGQRLVACLLDDAVGRCQSLLDL